MEESPAFSQYQNLDDYQKIQDLINNGEAEGVYLECKTAQGPNLGAGHKANLAEAVSGFSNSGGGVIIFGISTSKDSQRGLDILTEIVPIGNCRKLSKHIDVSIPTLVYPSVKGHVSRVLTRPKENRGVIVTYIPPTIGDPVQSLIDKKFYLRSGDGFSDMPYEVLKRMFAGTAGPELTPVFDNRLVTKPQGAWIVPIMLENLSSAVAERTEVCVEILSPGVCQNVQTVDSFRDESGMNPGKQIFMATIDTPIFRGLNVSAGRLSITMKKIKRSRRVVNLGITIYSSKMRARQWTMRVQLAQRGFSVRAIRDRFLY
jgi:schlafen family protein